MTGDDGQPFAFELLDAHDRSTFSCGVPALDRYLQQQAGQDRRRGAAIPYVIVDRATGLIAGYVTLSMSSVVLTSLPPEIVRRLPRYDQIPVALIGRLAVSTAYQGRGIGQALLVNAIDYAERASRSVAAFAVIVDAKDDAARTFYERHGFTRLLDDAYRLFLSMGAARDMLNRAGFRA